MGPTPQVIGNDNPSLESQCLAFIQTLVNQEIGFKFQLTSGSFSCSFENNGKRKIFSARIPTQVKHKSPSSRKRDAIRRQKFLESKKFPSSVDHGNPAQLACEISPEPAHKGSHRNLSFDKLGLLDQPAWPPPLPGGWDPDNKKFFWCLFCILGYSKHFIFSWKFSFFWLGLVGIEVYWGPMTSWIDEISPFMYCVFHHISDHLQRLILFLQILRKVGLRSAPPPWSFEAKSIRFWFRYRLEGNRSPQNGDICGSRDKTRSRNWGHSTVGKISGRRLLKMSRDHYK